MTDSSISDHIGRLGEIFFDDLATRAKLLVGKIEPDRFGKDRLLEFELAPRSDDEPFDKRSASLACAVQIKTILGSRSRVSLSLSVAERLINDTAPAFVCILRVDEAEGITDMHLVHLLDDNLGRVLKRLRKAFADGVQKLNKATITFAVSDGVGVELKPAALRDAIASLIGPDMHVYAEKKTSQRKLLGFEPEGRFSMNVTFEPMSPGDFVDGMLGLRKLNLTAIRTFEERFSIKLPEKHPFGEFESGVVLEITPTPQDQGTLTIREVTTRNSIQLPCDLISPGLPGLPREHFKLLARCPLLDVTFSDGVLKFTTTYGRGIERRIGDWIDFFKTWQSLASGECEFILQSNASGREMKGTGSASEAFKPLPEGLPKLFAEVQDIRLRAGRQDTPLSLDAVLGARGQINQVHRHLFHGNDLGPFIFQTDKPPTDIEVDIVPTLLVRTLSIGDEKYAYALRLELQWELLENGLTWTSAAMRPLVIESLPDFDALGAFRDRIATISGTMMSIIEQPEAPGET